MSNKKHKVKTPLVPSNVPAVIPPLPLTPTEIMSTEEMIQNLTGVLSQNKPKAPKPVIPQGTNPLTLSPEALTELSNEVSNEAMGDKEVAGPELRELKIDIFEYIKEHHNNGKEISLLDKLPEEFGWEEVIAIAEGFAQLNNFDTGLSVPDLPDQAYNKGLILGLGKALSDILNTDPEVREPELIIEDCINHLKKLNLYNATHQI